MPILGKGSRKFHGSQAEDDQPPNLYMVFLCIVYAQNSCLTNQRMSI